MKSSDLLLEKARRSLEVAERLIADGAPDFAASRLYYAYFYTAQALLETRGLEFSSHGRVIAQYGLHFSKTRLLDPAFHKLLDRAFDLRQIADYQVEVPTEPAMVEDLIPGCHRFITDASRYIESLSPPPSE
jgi:uncharacterized protein (UPF0332 family)